ncbi:3-hydroxyacyl-CoA dehydrogenase NAD-binding domain-containing protein [Amycolatopsis sp. PS_44_ISF1]|uniref:3-hydroxyacyl-CoA dehydrogenase NAD-binding domain-containing protein n=1 Tax=Amycolatopsis sp. PS_44_ISF1 TaxID=2974917 RepID=UPI0028DEEA75|nr:3-hydroxyacyl-CoA dehydrogenase NAD-binding domain-containing protein [Amycolatopsis sp. PS_44_ISF1]MDT8915937.1 3-hydroxyacyl-CoA dehydrogenase NAD-binding domain-containing protein [Amycolatopsis sp. PS_44_ISF1]
MKATIVGAGVIGVSWAGLMLSRGLEVTVSDPAPGIEAQVRAGLAELVPALRELGLPADRLEDRLSFEADLATAVAGAGVVQENGPERLELKHRIWSVIEAAAPADALLLTSTSGLPATEIATALRQPERLVVGHPFNPPHLIPLVEVVPGERTAAETVERAVAFYRSLGKRPIVLGKEVPGFVANRLQAALFRECVHLVAEGVVTEQQLDEVVTSSLGQRWAVSGPFLSFHLGGGAGGLPHFLDHLGPGLRRRWGQLGTPDLDRPTVALLSEQAAGFGGTVDELAKARDTAQIAVMRALGTTPGQES